MKKKIFRSIVFVSILTLFLTFVLTIVVLYGNFLKEQRQGLVVQAEFISKMLRTVGDDFLGEIEGTVGNRISLISSDGTVLFDNTANADVLENHIERAEIQAALKTGNGEAYRLSDSMGEYTSYYAMRLDDGKILRVSFTTRSIFGVIGNTAFLILLVVLFALAVAAFAARILTKRLINPINSIDIDNPLSNNTYEELTPLLKRLSKQKIKITNQVNELEAKQEEFNTITESMNEALVIFGGDRRVLRANTSAKKLFSAKTGMGYLELCRELGYINAVERAFSGEQVSESIKINDGVYQLLLGRVSTADYFAVVLFAFDKTKEEQNNRIRREFSANVSHELKTPLTSIMGYAEIMQNGIGKKEDYPRFTGQIYEQSKRMLSLIDDIIKLSRLDEGGEMLDFKTVCLKTLCQRVIEDLVDKADKRGIQILLEGMNIKVKGNEPLLYEMIFNLCDNAISYNKEKGKVWLSIEDVRGQTILTVRDSGIGISPENASRIFERFYRVPNSVGMTDGTGLGLSIVKHGASLHNAKIELESEVGKGTTMRLIFTLD